MQPAYILKSLLAVSRMLREVRQRCVTCHRRGPRKALEGLQRACSFSEPSVASRRVLKEQLPQPTAAHREWSGFAFGSLVLGLETLAVGPLALLDGYSRQAREFTAELLSKPSCRSERSRPAAIGNPLAHTTALGLSRASRY